MYVFYKDFLRTNTVYKVDFFFFLGTKIIAE